MTKDQIEREAIERYAREHMEDRDRRRAEEKAKNHPHRWNVKFTGTNQAIKRCVVPGCDEVVKKGWTNTQAREVMQNLEDFAQPGSELWNKKYGKNN